MATWHKTFFSFILSRMCWRTTDCQQGLSNKEKKTFFNIGWNQIKLFFLFSTTKSLDKSMNYKCNFVVQRFIFENCKNAKESFLTWTKWNQIKLFSLFSTKRKSLENQWIRNATMQFRSLFFRTVKLQKKRFSNFTHAFRQVFWTAFLN